MRQNQHVTTKLRCRVGASSQALDPIPSPLLRDSLQGLFLPPSGSSASPFLLAPSLSLAQVFNPSTHCLKILDPSSVYCLLFPSFPFLPSPSLSLSLIFSSSKPAFVQKSQALTGPTSPPPLIKPKANWHVLPSPYRNGNQQGPTT